MPTDDQSGKVPANSVRLKGFNRKDPPQNLNKAPETPVSPVEPAATSTPPKFTASTNTPVKEERSSTQPAEEKHSAESKAAESKATDAAPRVSTAFRTESSIGSTESVRNEAYTSHASPADRVAAPRNRAYVPDTDPERVRRRQWWKYDLYTRSGRKRADEEAGSRYAGEGRGQ